MCECEADHLFLSVLLSVVAFPSLVQTKIPGIVTRCGVSLPQQDHLVPVLTGTQNRSAAGGSPRFTPGADGQQEPHPGAREPRPRIH